MNVTGIIWTAIRRMIQEKESLLHDCLTPSPDVLHVSRTTKSGDARAQRPLTWRRNENKSEDTFEQRPAEREEDKNGQIMSKPPSQQTVSFSCHHSYCNRSFIHTHTYPSFPCTITRTRSQNDRPLNIYMSESKNTCSSSILYYRLWYKIRHFCVWAQVHLSM